MMGVKVVVESYSETDGGDDDERCASYGYS